MQQIDSALDLCSVLWVCNHQWSIAVRSNFLKRRELASIAAPETQESLQSDLKTASFVNKSFENAYFKKRLCCSSQTNNAELSRSGAEWSFLRRIALPFILSLSYLLKVRISHGLAPTCWRFIDLSKDFYVVVCVVHLSE